MLTSAGPFISTTTAISVTGLHDTLRTIQDQAAALRASTAESSNSRELADMLHQIGVYSLIIGDGAAALIALQEAVQHGAAFPALRLSLGQAYCYNGLYAQGKTLLEQVLADSLEETTRALCLLTLGSDYDRVHQPAEAANHLSQALTLLQFRRLDHPVVICLLALADVHRLRQDYAASDVLLKQSDSLITTCKLHWHRPEWWRLSALLALDRNDFGQAIKMASKGLGAVDNRGDVRALPGLYRALATALERQHERVEDARDARHRSVSAARVNAPRTQLAYSLLELGQHYKLFSNRPTLRARGSGYLFEAERLFHEMGLPQRP